MIDFPSKKMYRPTFCPSCKASLADVGYMVNGRWVCLTCATTEQEAREQAIKERERMEKQVKKLDFGTKFKLATIVKEEAPNRVFDDFSDAAEYFGKRIEAEVTVAMMRGVVNDIGVDLQFRRKTASRRNQWSATREHVTMLAKIVRDLGDRLGDKETVRELDKLFQEMGEA